MITECNDSVRDSYFDMFCIGDNYKDCSTWRSKYNPSRSPREWMKHMNIKAIDELYKDE